MDGEYTFTDDEASELRDLLWAVEEATEVDMATTKAALKDLHDWLASKAEDKGVNLPQERSGGTPKDNDPTPPHTGG